METKKIESLMKQYQEQTCDNFSDQNDDLDEIKGHLIQIEEMLTKILNER